MIMTVMCLLLSSCAANFDYKTAKTKERVGSKYAKVSSYEVKWHKSLFKKDK